MKTKSLKFNKLNALLIAIIFPFVIFSQIETSDIIVREFDVTPETTITFENKNDDVQVKAWDKNKVKLETTIWISAAEQEDIDITLDKMKTYPVEQSSTQLHLNTRFYKEYQNVVIMGIKKNKITFKDGSTARLKKFKLSYVLFVPRNNHLVFNTKYCDLKLPDLSGMVEIDMYSGDVEGSNIDQDVKVRLKYSSLTLKSVRECDLDIYDSKLELAETAGLRLKSKYSEIEIEKARAVKFECYTDKVFIKELDGIDGNAKYSTFELGDFGKGKFDIYDCDITAGKTDELFMNSKYSKIKIRSAAYFDFRESYDDKLEIGYLNMFQCSSKYTTFDIDEVGREFVLWGYDDEVAIDLIATDFMKIRIDGKYISADLNFEPGAQFKMTAKLTYPDLDFPKDKFKDVRYHKENSKFEYTGLSNNAPESIEAKVLFDMYDSDINIKL